MPNDYQTQNLGAYFQEFTAHWSKSSSTSTFLSFTTGRIPSQAGSHRMIHDDPTPSARSCSIGPGSPQSSGSLRWCSRGSSWPRDLSSGRHGLLETSTCFKRRPLIKRWDRKVRNLEICGKYVVNISTLCFSDCARYVVVIVPMILEFLCK